MPWALLAIAAMQMISTRHNVKQQERATKEAANRTAMDNSAEQSKELMDRLKKRGQQGTLLTGQQDTSASSMLGGSSSTTPQKTSILGG